MTLLCVTVNQNMFLFQKTGIQVTGISVIFFSLICGLKGTAFLEV